MRIKLSATFEGKCDLCGKETIVFTVGDEDSRKTVTLCKNCSDKLDGTPTSKVVKKYGKVNKKAFEKGVRIE
jgi:transcription elongation factor Elf1